MQSQQELIAKKIKSSRKQLGITQAEFAKALSTSQSAVNRMEAGKQNFSLDMLTRIGEVLGHELVTLADDSVNFRIVGGNELKGEITTKVSKNASVSLLAASLLNEGQTKLRNIPRIEEVNRLVEVLRSIGVSVEWVKNDLIIQPPKRLKLDKINRQAGAKTRSIIMFIGSLIHITNDFKLPYAGGCKLGERSIRPHLYGLEHFGVEVETKSHNYHVSVKGKTDDEEIILYEAGDTVTENVLMAAARKPGKTTIKFASANYMVQDLCYFLQELGVKIEGIGTTTLIVHGKTKIKKDVEYSPSEDPIEAMLFLSIAAVTKSSLTIKRCAIDFLELELLKLRKMGFHCETTKTYKAKNGRTDLVDIKTYPSDLVATPDKVAARPYPGLNIDNLPFFVPIAAVAKGRTLIHDWVYENRAVYYTELNKLGANIELADPHRVYVNGRTRFSAADMTAPPALRPAVIILTAMLAAKGTSTLRNVYSINRGYEDLASRLNSLGADITIF